MGLLDKLWDDVVAGPLPDHGLGRLRNHRKPVNPEGMDKGARRMEVQRGHSWPATQSIAISRPSPLRTDDCESSDTGGSLPSTPGAASTPTSPESLAGAFGFVEPVQLFPKAASSPTSPALGSPGARERENVWTSVFHPGSSKVMKKIGSEKFDKATPNSPTVYDWLVMSALDRC